MAPCSDSTGCLFNVLGTGHRCALSMANEGLIALPSLNMISDNMEDHGKTRALIESGGTVKLPVLLQISRFGNLNNASGHFILRFQFKRRLFQSVSL